MSLLLRKREGSRNSWYTPREVQADFSTNDVGGTPVEWILKTAVPVKVGRRTIRMIAFEGLIVAKYGAGRTQDIADLGQLMAHRGRDIRRDVMSNIGTDLEVAELRRIAKALAF